MKKFLVILTACAFLGPFFNACSDNEKECPSSDITCLRHCALNCMNSSGQFDSACIDTCGFPDDGSSNNSNDGGYHCESTDSHCIEICKTSCTFQGVDDATCDVLCSTGAF